MIPRLKPYLDLKELAALTSLRKQAVEEFESEFAKTFKVKYALAFPYGRSAQWALFKALRIEQAEIIQPAYTCSVVAHATVLSGNDPVFVDISLSDYNMQIESMAAAITTKTRAVIPTHLFGHPMDVQLVKQIVKDAEQRFGNRIYIIQDCAHSFDAEWRGQPVIQAGDAALFGLNISKQITSIFGGMLTTNDKEICSRIKTWRDEHFHSAHWIHSLQRALYLLVIYPAFNETIYGLTYWLQEKTAILNHLTKAYHLDEKIHFPPDYLSQMAPVEARVGLQQLKKYDHIKTRRREIAEVYFQNLKVPSSWTLPPQILGATYSHFAIRVPEREKCLRHFAQRGIQLGELVEYSIPHLSAYRANQKNKEFPNSLLCSHSMINLPIHPGLREKDIDKIINITKGING